MAVLALATDLADLRARLGRMIACFSRGGEPLTADDFLRPWTATTIEGLAAELSADDLSRVVNLRRSTTLLPSLALTASLPSLALTLPIIPCRSTCGPT